MIEGVNPSSFSASAIIDYTYMKNGMTPEVNFR